MLGALTAMPLGACLAVLGGVFLLGRQVWHRQPSQSKLDSRKTLELSLSALAAYAAYMILLNLDVIWANRVFPPAAAGGYAAAVVLRRIVILLPSAIVIVMYPRIVKLIGNQRAPDWLILQTAGSILLPTLLLTATYFAFGDHIISMMMGAGYESAGQLMGWMGLAMMGFGLTAMWLNVYLAIRPRPLCSCLRYPSSCKLQP